MNKGLHCKKIAVPYVNLARTFISCKAVGENTCLQNGSVLSPFNSLYCIQIQRFSQGRGNRTEKEKGYYDILGLTPKATQAQVSISVGYSVILH